MAKATRCAICDSVRTASVDYARRVLPEHSRREDNSRAIAESFGFCIGHARAILRAGECLFVNGECAASHDRPHAEAAEDVWAREIVAVASAAATSLLRMLELGLGRDVRVLDSVFRASSACPACSYVERRRSHLLSLEADAWRGGARSSVCLPHFRALIGHSKQGDLLRWVAIETESLVAAPRSLESLHLVAGSLEEAFEMVGETTEHSTRLTDLDAAGPYSTCAICAAVRHAHGAWLDSAAEAARLKVAEWATLPHCPSHLWDCFASGDAVLATHSVVHTIDAAIEALRQATVWLGNEERRFAAEAQSVWFRLPNPAYVLGQQRKALKALWHCPVCERLAIAQERAVSELCARLDDRCDRERFEHGPGLCIKHFAQSWLTASEGPARDTLTRAQATALRRLERECADSAKNSTWRTAILRFSPSLSGARC